MMKDNEKFSDWLKRNWEKDNLCPPPLNAQTAINILCNYLLCENDDWYIVMPVNNEQANTLIVEEILSRYSKQYKKEIKNEKVR